MADEGTMRDHIEDLMIENAALRLRVDLLTEENTNLRAEVDRQMRRVEQWMTKATR